MEYGAGCQPVFTQNVCSPTTTHPLMIVSDNPAKFANELKKIYKGTTFVRRLAYLSTWAATQAGPKSTTANTCVPYVSVMC